VLQHLEWCPIRQALMRSRVIIGHFPQPVLIPAFFRTTEPQDMTTCFVIRAMAPFDNTILPRRPGLNGPVLNPKRPRQALKGGSPLRMSAIAHRERHRIVGHDEKKGGNRSHARRRTPATVCDRESWWISEYFTRVPRCMTEILSSKPVCPSIAGNC